MTFEEVLPVTVIRRGMAIRREGKNFKILLKNGEMFVNEEKADKLASSSAISEFELTIPNRIKRKYCGKLFIFPSETKSFLTIVTEVPLEDYVAGIVYSEMGERAPIEAKKALAVVVRSFVLSSLNRHAKDGYDLCDTTHCAVYRGLEGGLELARVKTETRKTAGVVLIWGGKPIKAFFHSTCGGETHTPREVWGEDTDYPYRPVKCPYCAKAEHFKWSSRIKKTDLLAVFSLDDNREIVLTWRGNRIGVSSGSCFSLLTREEFRMAVGRKLGWSLILSPWFDFRDAGEVYIFEGHGFGHGVGLCEEGAMEMARRGSSWRMILRFYFPGAAF